MKGYKNLRWGSNTLGYVLFMEGVVYSMQHYKKVRFQQSWMGWESRRKESIPGNWYGMSKIQRVWAVFMDK